MNRLLFSVLFAGMANLAMAQKFSMGVNGGGSYSSAIKIVDKNTEFWLPTESESSFSPLVGLKGMIATGNWQFGLSLEQMQAKYRSRTMGGTVCYYIADPNAPLPPIRRDIALDRTSLFPVRAFVNRQINFGKFGVYGGLAASYIITPDRDASPWFGYGTGVQLGLLCPLSRRVNINIEAAGNKMWFRQGSNCLLTMYNTTAALGLTYRLK